MVLGMYRSIKQVWSALPTVILSIAMLLLHGAMRSRTQYRSQVRPSWVSMLRKSASSKFMIHLMEWTILFSVNFFSIAEGRYKNIRLRASAQDFLFLPTDISSP